MLHLDPELYVAQKVADTQREIEQIRLIRKAKGNNTSLQAWANNRMHDLSVWMICTGERLHERYHTTQIQHLPQRSTQAR